MGCEASSFDVDGFVAFVILDKFTGGVDPCFFDATCVAFDEFCDDIGDNERVVMCKFFDVDEGVFDTFCIGSVDEGVDEVSFFLHHECGGREFVDDVDVEVFAHCGKDGVSDSDSCVIVTLVVWVVPIVHVVCVAGVLGGFFGDGLEHGPVNGAVGVVGDDLHACECGWS